MKHKHLSNALICIAVHIVALALGVTVGYLAPRAVFMIMDVLGVR